jgi:hypothetical protein
VRTTRRRRRRTHRAGTTARRRRNETAPASRPRLRVCSSGEASSDGSTDGSEVWDGADELGAAAGVRGDAGTRRRSGARRDGTAPRRDDGAQREEERESRDRAPLDTTDSSSEARWRQVPVRVSDEGRTRPARITRRSSPSASRSSNGSRATPMMSAGAPGSSGARIMAVSHGLGAEPGLVQHHDLAHVDPRRHRPVADVGPVQHLPPARAKRNRLSDGDPDLRRVVAVTSGMSSVETRRIDFAMPSMTGSGTFSVHGQCATSSIPTPSARSAWPFPWTWAVTGSWNSLAVSTIASRSSSGGVGPALGVQRHLDVRGAEPGEMPDCARGFVGSPDLPSRSLRAPRSGVG